MKKRLICMVATLMVGLFLAACGDKTAKPTSGSESEIETSERDSVDSGIADDNKKPDNDQKGTNTVVAMPDFTTDATIEETVLIDENDVKVTATELIHTAHSVEVKLVIENNSSKDLSFCSGTIGYDCNSVNGYMMGGGYLHEKVPAGKKANASISFDVDELLLYGITEVADIQLGIEVKDDDYNRLYSGLRQIKTSAFDTYDHEKDTYLEMMTGGVWEAEYGCSIDYFSEEELYSQKDVRIVSEGLMCNSEGEKIFLIEMVNDSDRFLYASISDVAVNGLVVCDSTWTSESLNPHTRRVVDLTVTSMLDSSYWELVGLGDIGRLDFRMELKEENDSIRATQKEISICISNVETGFNQEGAVIFDEKGVRMVSKGLVEDSFSYSNDIHLLLLVENTSSVAVNIDDVYDSLSVNGFMTDFIMYSSRVAPGRSTILDIEIKGNSLEDNSIESIEDIANVELSFEIRTDKYKKIASPKVQITF